MTTKFSNISGYLMILACVLLISSCSESSTESGLQLEYLRKGDGEKVEAGNYLLMNMRYKDGNDSIWNDTEKNGGPMIVQMADSIESGDAVMEVFGMMKEGDSIQFKISSHNLFNNTFRRPLPDNLDSASLFTFNIGLEDIMTLEEAQAYDMRKRAEMEQKFREEQMGQLASDTLKIDAYLKENGLVARTTPSGLRYIVTKSGSGNRAQDGNTAYVHYAGYLLDGQFFDSSIANVARKAGTFDENRKYEPLQVVVGRRQVIPGWEEALTLMKKGSKMTVYIPSTLAYGPSQRGEVIKPNSILVFDMEMVDIQ